MRITKISLYQVDLPLKEGRYSWSIHSFAAFDSTVIMIETDEGITGVGETCPLGPTYLPAYAEGARTGIVKLAQGLIGEDPSQVARIGEKMEQLLKGHAYAKSAIDMACWDILGKVTGQPVYNLLGGKLQDKVTLFKVVSRDEPEAMARKLQHYQDQGFRQFQMKVGAGANKDIDRILAVSGALKAGNILAADANTGWKQHEALRVVKAVRDVDIFIEQPCLSYEECLVVRAHCDHPMILDECMDDVFTLMRGYHDKAMDAVNVKINRIGGISKTRQFRDLCTEMGIGVTIEDTWGGEIATSAIAHLGHSTQKGLHFQSSAFHEYHSLEIASGGPLVADGFMIAADKPGLGVEPHMDVLGKPVAVTS